MAGPRALEHLVDVVLHFDGDRHSQLRMVRAVKNRYGPTDEVGCFDLGEYGLIGLPDPSGLFLSQHREPVPGTCVTVTLEGRRPLPAEVQALVGDLSTRGAPARHVRAGRRPGGHGPRGPAAPGRGQARQAGRVRGDCGRRPPDRAFGGPGRRHRAGQFGGEPERAPRCRGHRRGRPGGRGAPRSRAWPGGWPKPSGWASGARSSRRGRGRDLESVGAQAAHPQPRRATPPWLSRSSRSLTSGRHYPRCWVSSSEDRRTRRNVRASLSYTAPARPAPAVPSRAEEASVTQPGRVIVRFQANDYLDRDAPAEPVLLGLPAAGAVG